MKHWIQCFISGLLCVVLLSGCVGGNTSDKSEDPTIQGYIMDINTDGKRVLVITDITEEESKSRTVEDILNNDGKPAYWFGVKKDDEFSGLKKGQKVEVAIEGGVVAESYPMQGTASRISILEDSK